MWTDQILKIVLQDCTSATTLTGIYSVNTLPKQDEYPATLKVDLSASSSPGAHWIDIYK